jgi:hypothetical protein
VKPYILISIWAQDDSATRLSHEFAQIFCNRHKPIHFEHGEAPSHNALKETIDRHPEAAIVIISHGGNALSARRGESWATPHQLAFMMSGRRVYSFACSTFTPQDKLLMNTFATLAVDACIEVFVGHRAPIMTPYSSVMSARQTMDDVISKMIETFVEGDDDASSLQDVGRRLVNWNLPVEIDLPSESPDSTGELNGWSSAAFLGVFFNNLCVETKQQPDHHCVCRRVICLTEAQHDSRPHRRRSPRHS